jgi:pilus assembly protein CpaF
MTGIDRGAGKAMGAFYATGYEPRSLQRLANLGYEVPHALFSARELTE